MPLSESARFSWQNGLGVHFCAELRDIQSAALQVEEEAHEPYLNPPVRMSFLPLALVLKCDAKKVLPTR